MKEKSWMARFLGYLINVINKKIHLRCSFVRMLAILTLIRCHVLIIRAIEHVIKELMLRCSF